MSADKATLKEEKGRVRGYGIASSHRRVAALRQMSVFLPIPARLSFFDPRPSA